MKDRLGKEIKIGDVLVRCGTYNRDKDLEFVLAVDITDTGKLKIVTRSSNACKASLIKCPDRLMKVNQHDPFLQNEIVELINQAGRFGFLTIAKDIFND